MPSSVSMNPCRVALGLDVSRGLSGLGSAALAAYENPNRRPNRTARPRQCARRTTVLLRFFTKDLPMPSFGPAVTCAAFAKVSSLRDIVTLTLGRWYQN